MAIDYHGQCAANGRGRGRVRDLGDGMSQDSIKQRLRTLSDEWARLTQDCPVLNALVSLWARTPSMTLKDVASKYLEASRADIGEWLKFNPALADGLRALLIEWRDEAPSLEDTEHWQHGEALRVCSPALRLRRAGLEIARRWHEMNFAPEIIITRHQAEELGIVKP